MNKNYINIEGKEVPLSEKTLAELKKRFLEKEKRYDHRKNRNTNKVERGGNSQ